MTAITTAAHIDAQTQEELMRQAGIWIEHSTLIEDDLPARPLAAVQAEKHQLDRYTQLVADRAAARAPQCLAQIEEPAQPVLYVSADQLADGLPPEKPGSTTATVLLPVRKTPAGKFTQPLYAGAAPAAVAGPAHPLGRTYPLTEQDGYRCAGCSRTFAEASQEEPGDTSCVYCGNDDWREVEAPAAPAQDIEGLLDEDGENQAVRTFLMLYGTGLTVAKMREHMALAGWPQTPEWATEAQGHLTKGGAQDWLRHLFSLEGSAPGVIQTAGSELDVAVRKKLGPLLNAFGEAQWQAGRGVPCPSIEDAFEAVISAAVDLLAAAPQAPNCTRCSGSGEDPEGYLTHGRGPDDQTVDGPCRECDGTGAAPQAPAAPWKDHQTARLVNDLRDCAIKYHGAGQLRERIAHIVVPLCDQLKGALAAPAAPAVDAETIEDAERFRAMAKAALTDDEVFERALDQHPDMGGDATIDDVRAMFDAAIAAQAKEGGA